MQNGKPPRPSSSDRKPPRPFVCWIPALLWAAGIYCLSALSNPPSPGPQFPFKDKVGHWLLFCGLGWLSAWALRRAHNFSLPKTFLLATLISSAYGASDEFHQLFVPHRSCELGDWLVDTLGASAAAAAFYVYESHRSAQANRQPA
jgi:VanZ family protein